MIIGQRAGRIKRWSNQAMHMMGLRSTGDRYILGDCVAENRGADFVQRLVLAPGARTRHWTGHRVVRKQACIRHGAGQRRD